MPAALSQSLKDQAYTLYMAGRQPVSISRELQILPHTVSMWANRYGWVKLRSEVGKRVEAQMSTVVVRGLLGTSQSTRKLLANQIEAQAQCLANEPIRAYGELLTNKEGQGRVAMTKTLVEAASTVFGWSAQDALDGAIVAGDMAKMEALDVEVEVVVNELVKNPSDSPTQ